MCLPCVRCVCVRCVFARVASHRDQNTHTGGKRFNQCAWVLNSEQSSDSTLWFRYDREDRCQPWHGGISQPIAGFAQCPIEKQTTSGGVTATPASAVWPIQLQASGRETVLSCWEHVLLGDLGNRPRVSTTPHKPRGQPSPDQSSGDVDRRDIGHSSSKCPDTTVVWMWPFTHLHRPAELGW